MRVTAELRALKQQSHIRSPTTAFCLATNIYDQVDNAFLRSLVKFHGC